MSEGWSVRRLPPTGPKMNGPRIGQRVLVSSPAYGGGPCPGQIVSVAFTGLCTIKLDRQLRAASNVKYFAKEPDVVDGRYWQVCYPDPQYGESEGELEVVQ